MIISLKCWKLILPSTTWCSASRRSRISSMSLLIWSASPGIIIITFTISSLSLSLQNTLLNNFKCVSPCFVLTGRFLGSAEPHLGRVSDRALQHSQHLQQYPLYPPSHLVKEALPSDCWAPPVCSARPWLAPLETLVLLQFAAHLATLVSWWVFTLPTLLLGHWYEIMALYYVKSILTEISASRQDRRVLQKSKIIRIEFLSKWGMLKTSRYV